MKLNRKGQALVETALVLPIIILLFMGMVEFTRIFGSYLIVTNASREGARMAALGRSDTQVVQTVKNKAGLLSATDIQVTISPSEASRKTGEDVKVTVKYKVVIYAPLISSLIPNPFSMETNTFMRVE